MTSSPWAEIASWALLPLVVWAISCGWGLALERVTSATLPASLVAPVGFAASLAVALLGHGLRLPWWLVVAVLIVVAVVAIGWERPDPRRLAGGWAGVAALAVYLVYASPVILHGHWTWGGYNFLNDTSYQFLLADWIRSGAPGLEFGHNNAGNAIRAYVATDYPLGSQAHLAAFTAMLGIGVEVGYQTYLAAAMAMAGMAVGGALTALRLRGPVAAVIAIVALSATLTFQFALQGSIKEVVFLATLLIACVVGREVVVNPRPVRVALVLGVTVAGVIAAYSAAALPYLGFLVLLTAVGLALREGGRRRWWAVPAAVLAFAAAAATSLGPVIGFAKTVLGVYASADAINGAGASTLGQLRAPLDVWQLGGVWLSGRYTEAIGGTAGLLTHVADVLVLVLMVFAGVVAILRRNWVVLLVAAPALLALAVVGPRVTPYVDAKMLAIAAPGVLVAAGGALAMGAARRATAVAGMLVGAALIVCIGISNAMALHDVQLAPTGRMGQLAAIGDRYEGKGKLAINEFEEFAKYFARHSQSEVPTDSTASAFVQLRFAASFLARTFDLDQELPAFVEAWPYWVVREKPSESRPPANYRLDGRTADYAVWKRTAKPEVLDHLSLGDVENPLGSGSHASAVPRCADVRALARKAPKGAHLVAARRPETAVMAVPRDLAFASPGWTPDAGAPDELALNVPGHANGSLRVRGGRYEVWVRGSFGRKLQVRVGGHDVGSVDGIDAPGAYKRAGAMTLGPGKVDVEVTRRGGRMVVGDGARSRWGGVTLVRAGSERLVSKPLSQASSLCGRQWDWVEVVRG